MKLYWGCGMKNYAKLGQMLLVMAFLLLPIVGIYTLLHTITGIRYVTFSFDPQLSPITCAAIKKKVMLAEHDGIYNPVAIVETILTSFPVVKSLEIEQFPPHIARVSIAAYDPIIGINNDRILIENQLILSADYYAAYRVKPLQKIRCSGPLPERISSSIMHAMKQCLAQKVFDYYTVYMVNEHEWYFTDIKDPLFTLCCNTASLPVDTVQIAYLQLKKQLKKESHAKKWIADMRFSDQIILSMDKGGRYG